MKFGRAERGGNVLPTRRSLRIRNRRMNMTLSWAELGLEGNALGTRGGGRRTKKKKFHSMLQRADSKQGSIVANKKIHPSMKKDESEQFLPHELIIEILRFLPVKCLLKFKCVCKKWFALIQECYFIEKHMNVSKTEYLYDSNVRTGEEKFFPLVIIDGLVLGKSSYNHKFRIRNPATRQSLYLPNPLQQYVFMTMFYLPIAKKYKVAYIYYNRRKNSVGCQVLTLGARLRWRTLDIPGLSDLQSDKLSGRNCFLALSCMFCIINHGYSKIVCIDMDGESSTSVKFPQHFISIPENLQLLDWDGKLSIIEVQEKPGKWKLRAWILEDLGKQKWAEKQIDIPLTFMETYPNASDLFLLYVDDGWLWSYVDNKYRVCYHINSKRTMATIPGEGFLGYIFPSLVSLEGMKTEGVKRNRRRQNS